MRYTKRSLEAELARSLPTTSILVVTTEIYLTSKNCKFKAFADVFKAWEWVHSILHSILSLNRLFCRVRRRVDCVDTPSKSQKFQFFSMQNLAFLKIPPAVNVLTRSQKVFETSHNAIRDSINLFRGRLD